MFGCESGSKKKLVVAICCHEQLSVGPQYLSSTHDQAFALTKNEPNRLNRQKGLLEYTICARKFRQ